MDPRLADILAKQQAARFAGMAGSEIRATIRLSDDLLNELIASSLPASAPVRNVRVRAREGNWLQVTLNITKATFLPALNVELAIDRQPNLPADALLVLRLTGGAGGLMRLAGQMLAGRPLAAGVRLEGDRLIVDLKAALQDRGHAALLEYAQELCITTEEAGVAVLVVGRVS